jgi:hypothetical protein
VDFTRRLAPVNIPRGAGEGEEERGGGYRVRISGPSPCAGAPNRRNDRMGPAGGARRCGRHPTRARPGATRAASRGGDGRSGPGPIGSPVPRPFGDPRSTEQAHDCSAPQIAQPSRSVSNVPVAPLVPSPQTAFLAPGWSASRQEESWQSPAPGPCMPPTVAIP